MNPNFKTLIDKYLNGSLSSQEQQELYDLLQQEPHLSELEQMIGSQLRLDHPAAKEDHTIKSSIWLQLESRMDEYDQPFVTPPSTPIRRMPKFLRTLAAACLILILAGAAIIFLRHPAPQLKTLAAAPAPAPKIVPGSNKATLTLADGTQIQLDDSQKGAIATQGGVKVIKLDNGILAYNGNGSNGEMLYNTIATPRGGQYEIVLPDGSHAWLNSASSLRFPAKFAGPRREVSLNGQGYFEIAKNKDQPFIVHTALTDIKVLGTSFDIMAYNDEPEANTTLVNGAVSVSRLGKEQLLQPGQQAHLDIAAQSMGIRLADIDEVTAWKNGKFQFKKDNIKTIMRQIARWYDVEIEYKGDLSAIQLSGIISRKGDVSELLDALELTGDVHFITGNHRITVMPAPLKQSPEKKS